MTPAGPARRGNAARDVGQGMAKVVIRVRLLGGDWLDVSYEDPQTSEVQEVIEHVIATLGQDAGALRTEHGDRLVVLYGRGVAAVEIAPRGAIL